MIQCKDCKSIFSNKYAPSSLCPVCGHTLQPSDKSRTAHGPDLLDDCSNYDPHAYPRGLNTVDTLISKFDFKSNEVQVLVIQRAANPFKGRLALSGGYVEVAKGEKLEDAALRELEEETGVSGIPVTQMGAYNVQDPRGYTITVAYYSYLSPEQTSRLDIKAQDDASGYQWVNALGGHSLAFSHDEILKDYVRVMRTQVGQAAMQFLPRQFTSAELSAVLNAILVTRRFRQPALAFSYMRVRGWKVLKVGTLRNEGAGRPVSLYSLEPKECKD